MTTNSNKSRLSIHGSASIEAAAVTLLVGMAGAGAFGVLGRGMDAGIRGDGATASAASAPARGAMAVSREAASLGALEQVVKYAEVSERWSAQAQGLLWRMPMPRSTVRWIAEAAVAPPQTGRNLVDALGDAAPARFFWDNEASGAPRRLQIINSLKDTADEFNRLLGDEAGTRILSGEFSSTKDGFRLRREVELMLRDVWRGRGDKAAARIRKIRGTGLPVDYMYAWRMEQLAAAFKPGRAAYSRVPRGDIDVYFGKFMRDAEARHVNTLGEPAHVTPPFDGVEPTVIEKGALSPGPSIPVYKWNTFAGLHLSELDVHGTVDDAVARARQERPYMTDKQEAVLRTVLQDLRVELQVDLDSKVTAKGRPYEVPASYKIEAARRALAGDASGIERARVAKAGLSPELTARLKAVAKITGSGITFEDFTAAFGK